MALEKENPLRKKSYSFALKAIKANERLLEKKQFVLAKQFLRSGTSIGANVEEALQGQSTKDFISKLSIALKESVETDYWVRLLADTGSFTAEEAQSLRNDLLELTKILTSIIKTTKSKSGD